MNDTSNTGTSMRGSSTAEGGRNTYIAGGVKVKGEITGRGEITIDGDVEGRLLVQSVVTVGRQGKVNGDIVARTVQVAGRVQGNVRADERFELQASGRIEGDVTAPRVVIAEGSFFKGNVEMTGDKAGQRTS